MILNNSNIIALVGAEPNKESEWSKSKVHLWDIEKSASLGSIKFKRDIKSIRIFDNLYGQYSNNINYLVSSQF
jgi:hypothetical protein